MGIRVVVLGTACYDGGVFAREILFWVGVGIDKDLLVGIVLFYVLVLGCLGLCQWVGLL